MSIEIEMFIFSFFSEKELSEKNLAKINVIPTHNHLHYNN